MNERVKAIVTIIVTAGVNIANVCGFAFDVDAWVSVALSIASAITVLWAWWKNQNVTAEAIQAQATLDHLKAERKALEAREEMEDDDA